MVSILAKHGCHTLIIYPYTVKTGEHSVFAIIFVKKCKQMFVYITEGKSPNRNNISQQIPTVSVAKMLLR